MPDDDILSIEEHRRRQEQRGEEKMCAHCGEWNPPDARQCTYCSHQLTDEEPLLMRGPSQGETPYVLRHLAGIAGVIAVLMLAALMILLFTGF